MPNYAAKGHFILMTSSVTLQQSFEHVTVTMFDRIHFSAEELESHLAF